ncbi:MAG TPA: sugar phosphate isomerase/epimerase [Acidimicrobiales bacterium]|nr:sugar phosphate isomerase/epimerase [Acidimicrobiales bacterium]
MPLGICTATVMVDPLGAADADIRAAGRALVAAGVSEASVWTFHIPALADLDLHIEVVEAASAWADTSAAEAAAEAEQIAETAKAVGASKIAAITLEASLSDLDHSRDNLALLVAAASDVGAQVCVEFLPWSGIPDLATAWQLVEPLGAGAGILIDAWHWVRQPGGPNSELLARIPGERIGYVQLCDAAAQPSDDMMNEALAHRLLPGDGVVDFRALLGQLDAIGARPFVATEVFNPELVRTHGADEAARMMAAAARPLVD